MIHESILSTIGNTPIVRLRRIEAKFGLNAEIHAKIESFNPGGSVKDRIALNMIEKAEKEGLLKPSSTIIEPTSGNTGIGLAMVGAVKGYKMIFVMPDTASEERRKLMMAYGAELVVTRGDKGIAESVRIARELASSISGAFIPSQFDNTHNPEAHFLYTAEEIIAEFPKGPDVFVAGVGTGGTITGVGKHFREHHLKVYIVAVEPAGSPMISQNRKGQHKIQGIGAGFIPDILDRSLIDEVLTVTDEAAISNARNLAKYEGIVAGISAGAALQAAITLAKRPEYAHNSILFIMPDTGERYLSTGLF